ncbi:MAG: PaaI family thioesterase [Hyphomonadaceae bacterium]
MSETEAQVSDEDLLARIRNSKNRPKSSVTLGFDIVTLSQAEKSCEITFEGKPEFCNPMGQIQGGFLCAMLDEVMSVACSVTSGMTHVVSSLEIKTSYFRAATPGTIRGIGRVVKWGRTVAFVEGELFDSEGRMLAKASMTALPQPYSKFKK